MANRDNSVFDSNLTNSISDNSLLLNSSFINGQKTSTVLTRADVDHKFTVLNPATGKILASVVSCTEEDIHSAISFAHAAFREYKHKLAKDRSKLLHEIARLHHEHLDDLARIITFESGKVFSEAKGEILYGASYFDFFAEECSRIYGVIIPNNIENKQIHVTKEPIGVCGIIAPWNFPNAMISRKVAAALGAGCTTVIKPAAETPLSCLALCEIITRAQQNVGVNIPGLVNAVVCDKGSAKMVSKVFSERKEVRKLSFTGSTAVGKVLYEQCAKTVKKLSLELGGNAPFIIFPDADVKLAVEGLMLSKFRACGQTCVCANRVFVHSSLVEEVTSRILESLKGLKLGFGLDEGVKLGPLISSQAVEKCEKFIADAVQKGAKVIAGGKRAEKLSGFFFEPTVVKDVTDDMMLAEQEIFGPVVSLLTFNTEEEVIKRANNTESGLAAYFYTSNAARIFNVRNALEYGMVGVNTGAISSELAPFGGIKESGFGREGSKYGLEDYLVIKYTALTV